jgi:hypothetical protein
LALAASEYLFLTELNTHQRLFILFPALFVSIVSIVTIFLFYRHLRKEF